MAEGPRVKRQAPCTGRTAAASGHGWPLRLTPWLISPLACSGCSRITMAAVSPGQPLLPPSPAQPGSVGSPAWIADYHTFGKAAAGGTVFPPCNSALAMARYLSYSDLQREIDTLVSENEELTQLLDLVRENQELRSILHNQFNESTTLLNVAESTRIEGQGRAEGGSM